MTGSQSASVPEAAHGVQEVAACPNCDARLTVCGQRESAAGQITAYEVSCPVCWAAVPFAIPGFIDPAKACLICYERPLRVLAPAQRRQRPQAEAVKP